MIQAKSILDKLIILTAVDQHTRVWQDYLPLKKRNLGKRIARDLI